MVNQAIKICSKCEVEKELIPDNYRVCKYPNGTPYFKAMCRDCENTDAKKYAAMHKEEVKIYNIKFLNSNPNYKKQWRKENRDRLNEQYRERIATDIIFKLRKNCSRAITRMLHKNGTTKRDCSILEFLPYFLDELKQHLESQFEPWMNWDNWGTYNSKLWNNEDSSTWTWQIDHIIPHSTFKYDSMDNTAFIQCWALSNLRPLSAKQNLIDGASKIRHKTK